MSTPPPSRRGPLRVPVLGQPTSSSCGTTSLRSVLLYHGLGVSLARLRRACGTTRNGTDHRGIIDGALAVGARVFAKAGGTLSELRWFAERGLPSIVGWWSEELGDAPFDPRWSLTERRTRDCGHFSVCRGVGAQSVWLMDPQWRGTGASERIVGNCAMPRRDFLRVWYDTDTVRYASVLRWYAVVHFDEDGFAGRFRDGIDHRKA